MFEVKILRLIIHIPALVYLRFRQFLLLHHCHNSSWKIELSSASHFLIISLCLVSINASCQRRRIATTELNKWLFTVQYISNSLSQPGAGVRQMIDGGFILSMQFSIH